MLAIIYHSIFYLALFLSIMEQIIWRGERSFLYGIPFLLLFLQLLVANRQSTYKSIFLWCILGGEILLLNFTTHDALPKYEHLLGLITLPILCWWSITKTLKDTASLRIPILFTLCFLITLTFSFLANLGQREYFLMAEEPIGILVYADIWCLLALLALTSISFLAKSIIPFLLAALTTLFCLLYLMDTLPVTSDTELIHLEAEHQFRLASCFLLLLSSLFLFILPPIGIFSGKNILLKRLDQLGTALFFIAIGGLTLSLQNKVRTISCVRSYPDYKISEEMALHLFVAEDPLYYFHHGIEFHGIRMATARFLDTGSRRFGGSSLSMQLAKVCYLPFEKTFTRKAKQAILGVLLEFQYSKEDIMASYLETISFSHRAKGLTEASKTHFNKTPLELGEEEAMLLTLSIQDPYSFNPDSKEKSRIIRQRAAVTRGRVRVFRPLLIKNLRTFNSIE